MDYLEMMHPHLRSVKPYIPGKPIEELRREKNIEGEIIKLASNENPYGPIDEVRQAIIDELSQVNRYPNSGCYDLCNELAAFYVVKPGQIFVGNGSNEILDLLVRAFVKPDEEIVYPWPSFIVYPIVTQLSGANAVEVPLRDFRLDLEAMAEAVTRKTKLVFVCNPNNPTGTYVSQDEVTRFLDRIPDSVIVAFDEAYLEYVTAEDYPDSLELLRKHDNIVITRTFSKIHSLSGLRIGYSISHEDLVLCLHKVRQPFNVNSIAQVAAVAALRNMSRIIPRVKENREQLHFVREELQKLGFTVPPSQTNFLLAMPPPGCGAIIEKLLDRGIIVRGMKPFGYGGESFRVTIGTPDENRKFIDALKEIM